MAAGVGRHQEAIRAMVVLGPTSIRSPRRQIVTPDAEVPPWN